MAWFKREPAELDTSGEKSVKTEGLWVKCDQCRQIIWKKDLDQNLNVCPKCDRHFRIDARTRLSYLLDDGEYEVEDNNLVSTDPLKFTDLKPYADRLKRAQEDTGLNDAVINARGKLERQARHRQRHGVFVHRRLNGRRRWRNHHPRHRDGRPTEKFRSSSSPPPAARA